MTKRLVAIKFDNTPRYIETVVARDFTESALLDALMQLRPLVHARGYNSRPIELSDIRVVCSEFWRSRVEELPTKYRKLRVEYVPPTLLKTQFSWALVFGVDAVVNLCPS